MENTKEPLPSNGILGSRYRKAMERSDTRHRPVSALPLSSLKQCLTCLNCCSVLYYNGYANTSQIDGISVQTSEPHQQPAKG